MFRLTKVTDYGIVLLTHMAENDHDQPHTARDLAAASGLPLPMVSKILKALAREHLLESHRGTKGGYNLARAADEISVLEIIGALEGPIAITECLSDSDQRCHVERLCPVRVSWKRINEAVHQALEGISLQDMMAPAAGNGNASAHRAEARNETELQVS